MNLAELWLLTEWIESEIKDGGIAAKYQSLSNALRANAQGSQAQQPFEEERNDLLASIRQVRLAALTQEQLDFLDRIGIGQYVGEHGAHEIENVLYRNQLDIASAASWMESALNSINEGVTRSDQVRAAVGDVLPQLKHPPSDAVLVRVKFAGGASIDNIVDLKKWADSWHRIARGLTMAAGEAPESFRMVSAGTGSIVLEFAVAVGVGHLVASLLYSALKVTERVLGVLNGAADLRNKKLLSEKLLLEIEREARETEEAGANEISSELVEQLSLDVKSQGDRVQALERSVREVVEFLRLGGEVDLVLPPPEAEAEGEDEDVPETTELRELRASVEEIRRLEARVRALEAGTDKRDAEAS